MSTWLITLKLANQRAQKVLFTRGVYTNNSNCHVQLGGLKEIIKPNSPQQFIKRNTHNPFLWQTPPRGSSCLLGLLLVR